VRLLLVRDVGGVGPGSPARSFDLGDEGVEAVLAARPERDDTTLGRDGSRRGRADARRSSGDRDDLAVK
jgi:hypothetical protein